MRAATLLPAIACTFLAATPAVADPVSMTKNVTMVSSPLPDLGTRLLPDGVADYSTVVTNPLGNTLKSVRGLVLEETLPRSVVMRVTDLAATGKGPVEFADINLLGTGLLSSGLGFGYVSLTAPGDALEFFDGHRWDYRPAPDAQGYDANVRAIRVTLSGNFAAGASFQLRYRARIR